MISLAFSFANFFVATLLLVNAVAILNEERFLARSIGGSVQSLNLL